MMDKMLAATIGREALAALGEVARKHGLKVELKGGSFDPQAGTFGPKIVFKEEDSEERVFRQWARLFGLDPDHFGRTFSANGAIYTVVGLRPSAQKMPVIVAGRGKRYTMTVDYVLAQLKAQEPHEVTNA